jgi:small subunit ribosomal protein S1
MKRKNYSCFDYEADERDLLEKAYSNSFPDELPSDFTGKDLSQNSSTQVTITKVNPENGTALGETPFGQSIVIDITKEIKSLRRLGYPSVDVEEGQILDVVINKDGAGNYNGSVSAGYEKALKRELHKSIRDENCAYQVKVKSVCNGGFMVDLSGIECFLPGSLAAANRIIDFSDYVGKSITVMVEVYDQKRDIFVVSFKKYLRKIIDAEVQNLSFSNKYSGIVTGSSNSGVFVEWEEIFTGIVPFEDQNRESLEKLKPGDPIDFFVTDIKNPQRIVLSVTEANSKMKGIQSLKDSSAEVLGEKSQSTTYKAEISKIKTFGAFVKLENGLLGLVEKEKLVNPIKNYEVGQIISCYVLSVDLSTLKVQLSELE